VNADITRYVNITHAHNVLASIGEDAHRVAALTDSCPFDEGIGYGPLHEALTTYRDAAGRAATGEAAPLTPVEVDDLYSIALAEALDTIAERAAVLARRASAVRHALDAGLITTPREWSADDINAGRMLTALEPNTAGADDDEYEWYGFDAMHLTGCVDALNRERLAGGVEHDTYDRHMARIAALAGVVGERPAGDAERVAAAVAQWKAEEAEAAAVLAEPGQTLPQRHAISLARTYQRLAAFAADLTGPGWNDDRRTADKHMAHVYRVALGLGTDAHGKGPKSPEAADLFAALDEWRMNAYAARMKAVTGVYRDGDDGEGRTEEETAAAEEAAYLALYDATDFAASTGQLLQVWDHATGLEANHADIIRTGVILHFEESRTGTGCTLVDGGPFAEHTKTLRTRVDAHPVPALSNITHTVNYRALRKTIEDIDMGATPAPSADTKLIHAWNAVVRAADADDITRRQVRELRDLVNAKTAEWCRGDEYRNASLLGRLPEWERIRDELNA
jgi:hypothetical protein